MIQQQLFSDLTAGEVDPSYAGRPDLPIYTRGLLAMENFIPRIPGGAEYRPGFSHCGLLLGESILYPFIVNRDLSYILELSDKTIRFWYEENAILSIQTPYTRDQLRALYFTQTATDLIVTHRDHQPHRLKFQGFHQFTFGPLPLKGNAGKVPFQSAGNYPAVCGMFNGRLFMASTLLQPTTIWASKPYEIDNYTEYETLATTTKQLKDPDTWADPATPEWEDVTYTRDLVRADNAFQMELASDQNEEIVGLLAGKDLIVLTTTGERIIPPSVTATSLGCHRQTAYGSAATQPFMFADALLFVEAGARTVREYQYRQEAGAYQSPELTFSSRHLIDAPIVDFDYQNRPSPILWACLENGQLRGCAYARAYGLAAWFRVTTAGVINSVAVIPDASGDRVYIAVQRNGAWRLERMDDALRLDAGKMEINNNGFITGITWLSGSAVAVYNGSHWPIEITNGNAALPAEIPNGASVQVGLPYQGHIQTMPTQTETPLGHGTMRKRNITRMLCRVAESYPFRAGASPNQTDRVQFTGPSTGDYSIPMRGTWDRQGCIYIIQDEPHPVHLLAFTAEIDSGG